jgi:hypothetical protein
MKHRKLLIGLALLGAALTAQFAVASAMQTAKGQPTKFTVRVENISNSEGLTASSGAMSAS